MSTKEQLLACLEGRRGEFLSGEELAARLGVSRAAVCKAIKTLRQEGCPIRAVTNRGYCLSSDSDIFSAQGVQKHLTCPVSVTFEKSLDSTNTTLRQMAEQGAPAGTVVLAGEQRQGRGRGGRSFYSPADTGIYLSLLLRPKDPEGIATVTCLAAVALCRAVEQVSGEKPQIKWVNDLYLNGRKISGILTEAAFSMESGMPEYIVVGVGLNAYAPAGGFPRELRDIAGAIWSQPVPDGRNRLAAAFLNEFWTLFHAGDFLSFREDYRRRSLVLGKRIAVLAGGTERPAKALDIDHRCRLLVEYEDGETACLSYGEVRIIPSPAG